MSNTKGVAVSFTWPTILLILSIVMRVTGITTMNWWWVFSPIWIPPAIILTIAIGGAVILGLCLSFEWCSKKYMRRFDR